jgi:hypothetical protein
MGVKKQMALVMTLCKLHNFCIGLDDDEEEDGDDDNDNVPSLEARDEHCISSAGGIDQRESRDVAAGPAELLNDGEHFDDVDVDDLTRNPRGTRRRLLQMVVDSDLHWNLASSRQYQSNLN